MKKMYLITITPELEAPLTHCARSGTAAGAVNLAMLEYKKRREFGSAISFTDGTITIKIKRAYKTEVTIWQQENPERKVLERKQTR